MPIPGKWCDRMPNRTLRRRATIAVATAYPAPMTSHPAPAYDAGGVARDLVQLFEAHAAGTDGRIRVEDLLSGAAAACGEACIAAAGEFDPEHHDFTPGAVVMSDRINAILAGDSSEWSGAGGSVFGLIRAGALARGYADTDFPPLADVFREFAAGIAGGDAGWGFVPLSVPADHRPRVQPLRSAYELRGTVRALLADRGVPVEDWPGVFALALIGELEHVRDAIDHGIAVRLVLETVNGMAKTAPMTDRALHQVDD
jgi:hypothetical protein